MLVKNRLRAMIGIQTEPDGFIRKMELKDGRRFTNDIYFMYQQTESLSELINEYYRMEAGVLFLSFHSGMAWRLRGPSNDIHNGNNLDRNREAIRLVALGSVAR